MSAGIVVERVGPGVTVQDRGRFGRMHEGVPRGGPLDPSLFERVQRSLGNAPDAAAVEIPWHGARFCAKGEVVVSVDGELRTLVDGEALEVTPSRHAVRYLGLRGGVDVPRALGGRGTLLVAALGGLDGRMLRRGDLLRAGDEASEAPRSLAEEVDLVAPIDVMPGPRPLRGGVAARHSTR